MEKVKEGLVGSMFKNYISGSRNWLRQKRIHRLKAHSRKITMLYEIVQFDNPIMGSELHEQHLPVYNCIREVERSGVTIGFKEEACAGDNLDSGA